MKAVVNINEYRAEKNARIQARIDSYRATWENAIWVPTYFYPQFFPVESYQAFDVQKRFAN